VAASGTHIAQIDRLRLEACDATAVGFLEAPDDPAIFAALFTLPGLLKAAA
jgi:hypothetical protein